MPTSAAIPALLRQAVREYGSRPAVIAPERELSWHQLWEESSRFASMLIASGVRPGDSIVWQLPNWWEATVVAHGIWAAGAISVPIVPIFREHEITAVVTAVQPRCVVTAASFRATDHVALFEASLQRAGVTPALRVVVRGAARGWRAFEESSSASVIDSADFGSEAGDPALIGFTSGTTGGAKGVLHSSRGFISVARSIQPACGFTWSDVAYIASPLSHAAGLTWGLGAPLVSGAAMVLREAWDAERAIDDIETFGVTYSTGPALFLTEIVHALEARGQETLPLRTGFTVGGTSLPDSVIEAADRVGLRPLRGYGMTECPMVAMGRAFDPRSQRLHSDGRPTSGSEMKVVGEDGTVQPPGGEGEIYVRGNQRALRYLDPSDDVAFTDDGWFRTGDLGMLDADGFVRVTGRLKDIINRGGEKFSAREIEDLLAGHPAISEVAVTAAPHERLGEQPAAFVVVRTGVVFDDAEAARYLKELGLSSQKIPRIWRQVDSLPKTAFGKVIKRDLTLGTIV